MSESSTPRRGNTTPPPPHPPKPEMRKRSTNVQLGPADHVMLAEIMERLAVPKGEAVRTAIRVYHALLTRGL